jgi:hypothetical protein
MKSVDELSIGQSSLGNENTDDIMTKSGTLFPGMLNPQWNASVKPMPKPDIDELNINIDKSLLFSQPKSNDDCDICCVKLPEFNKCHYQSCCGNVLCLGCIVTVAEQQIKRNIIKGTNKLPACPFCRMGAVTSISEAYDRLEARVKAYPNDSRVLFVLGCLCCEGEYSTIAQDIDRGIRLLRKASELGSIDACASLGNAFNPLERTMYIGVERNLLTSVQYYEKAAIGGHVWSRFNLGVLNYTFYFDRSVTMNHFIIAAKQGHDVALKAVKIGYMAGDVEKEQYASTLRAHFKSKTDIESDRRKDAEKRIRITELGEHWVIF